MKRDPKEINGWQLLMCAKEINGWQLMCANTDQAIKYYQDATIENEAWKDTAINSTLTPTDSTTKESQASLSYQGNTRCATSVRT